MCRLCFKELPESEFIHRKYGQWMGRCYDCRSLKGKPKKQAQSRLKAIVRYLNYISRLPLKPVHYHTYIVSEEWRKKRDALILRKKGKCFVCAITGIQMHAHHVRYTRLGYEKKGDLQLLCGICHAAVHTKFGRGKDEYKVGGLRKQLKLYAKQYGVSLNDLRIKNKKAYALFVARCFQVYTHLFVRRIFK